MDHLASVIAVVVVVAVIAVLFGPMTYLQILRYFRHLAY